MSPFRKLVVPLSILVLAIFFRPEIIRLYSTYGQLFDWAPNIMLGSALILSVSFNHSRFFTLSLAMLTTYLVIKLLLQSSLDDSYNLYIYTSISIFFPALALTMLFVKEKGLKNKHGLMVTSIFIVLVLLILLINLIIPGQLLTDTINSYAPIRPFEGYILSWTATILFTLTIIAAFFRLNQTYDDFIAINLAILVFVYITLAFLYQDKISTIIFAAAGLALVISLLRNSYNMAYRDDLTGLLSRRAFNVRLKGLGKLYVIAMMDIDHFKKFNDTYGHEIGDDVLKMVATKLDGVQGGGTTYRYGGEEFCIVFPGKDLDDCEPFLEAIRKKVENHKMIVRDVTHRPKSNEIAMERRGRRENSRDSKIVSVTISIGAAEREEMAEKPDEVLKRADKALYKAKAKGRNCLVLDE